VNGPSLIARAKQRLRSAITLARCRADLLLAPHGAVAFFLPLKGHYKFVQGTIATLRSQGIKVHCFTAEEHLADYRSVLAMTKVFPERFCVRIPYKVVVTPATHVRPVVYRHPRSQVVHLPHSMVSLHTIFPNETFLGHDHVFCCGPHHVREIEAIFRFNGQRGRPWGTGYEVIDRLGTQALPLSQRTGKACVLIAPTWGENSLLYRHGRALIDRLIHEHDIILRPHPWRMDQIAELIAGIRSDYSSHPGFTFDNAVDAKPSMDRAHIMICDFSGTAFEFALGYRRPVLFVDGPRKNEHLAYRSILDEEGIEVRGRGRIGRIVNDLDELLAAIPPMLDSLPDWYEKLTERRSEFLFNYGRCAETAASAIRTILGSGSPGSRRTAKGAGESCGLG